MARSSVTSKTGITTPTKSKRDPPLQLGYRRRLLWSPARRTDYLQLGYSTIRRSALLGYRGLHGLSSQLSRLLLCRFANRICIERKPCFLRDREKKEKNEKKKKEKPSPPPSHLTSPAELRGDTRAGKADAVARGRGESRAVYPFWAFSPLPPSLPPHSTWRWRGLPLSILYIYRCRAALVPALQEQTSNKYCMILLSPLVLRSPVAGRWRPTLHIPPNQPARPTIPQQRNRGKSAT